MTNRTYPRPYSASVLSKKPRLKRFDVRFDGPPPPTPEGLNNGMKPHGGYRGLKQLPPSQFSFDKDEIYQHDINTEYNSVVNHENYALHGAPYWVNDVQKEITNSGESPLFTNNLLATGKFEQEHGSIHFERALLSSNRRRLAKPRRRHLNGKKEYYRPNSTHQYLSATDLRNLNENEEIMVRYGRPTRTTLLRARQRTNSAPVNAYDLRRENKRAEDAKSQSMFAASRDLFERETTPISYRSYNMYATNGETMHSFLTGARYNRAHLVDSKGLTVYGVYMPRENPAECFIAGPRRLKDVGEDIPSAPPDSPRSDIEETLSPTNVSRPTSSRPTPSRPTSSSSRSITKQWSSRPASNRKQISFPTKLSRPVSAKDSNTRSLPSKSSDGAKKETHFPDELTMSVPEHINKTGKHGVYVTLKGQKMIESVQSKLPRVTGISFPKIRKSRDFVEEIHYTSQPPPTPVDPSAVSHNRSRVEPSHADEHSEINANEDKKELQEPTEEIDKVNTKVELITDNAMPRHVVTEDISEVDIVENKMTEKKYMEIGLRKKVNFSTDQNEDKKILSKNDEFRINAEETSKTTTNAGMLVENNDKVLFFMTEESDENKLCEHDETILNQNDDKFKVTENMLDAEDVVETEHTNNEHNKNPNEVTDDVDDVIKVEILEMERNRKENDDENPEKDPVTSDNFPFKIEDEAKC